jgi:hypothetical protein
MSRSAELDNYEHYMNSTQQPVVLEKPSPRAPDMNPEEIEAYTMLSAVCCLLSAVCCLLSAVCCLLSAACCLLLTVCCLLFAVCCLLPASCYLLS